MENLKKVRSLYRKYIKWGYNMRESAEKAVHEVFSPHSPHIYKNEEYDEPLFVYDKEFVLFFDGDIYQRIIED